MADGGAGCVGRVRAAALVLHVLPNRRRERGTAHRCAAAPIDLRAAQQNSFSADGLAVVAPVARVDGATSRYRAGDAGQGGVRVGRSGGRAGAAATGNAVVRVGAGFGDRSAVGAGAGALAAVVAA